MEKINLGKIEKLDYGRNEAYKSLRTNLSFCGDDVKVIVLTSCTPNEGKSTVAINLGMTLAADGKKTVIVDADLRKSVLVGRHGITSDNDIKGLSHYLSGQEKFERVLCETDVDNMYMILAGPVTPNPTELLGNKYFTRLIERLREEFDYVIIDAPPLGSVIDAAIITKESDGIVMVVESNRISYRFAQNVKKQLENTDCKILGAVLNKVDAERVGYYKKYGGRYGRYGKYGKYGKYGYGYGYGEENLDKLD